MSDEGSSTKAQDLDQKEDVPKSADGNGDKKQQECKESSVGQCIKPPPKCDKPKTSYWSKPRNWIALLTLLFVGTYTVVTVFIWCTSKDTLKETKKQTAAAERQADAASRPHVFVSFSGGETILNWTFERSVIDVRLKLTNFGAGPAIIKRVGCLIAWGNQSGPPADAIKVASTEQNYATSGIEPEAIIGSKDSREVGCNRGWPMNGRELFYVGQIPNESSQRMREVIQTHPIWVVGLVEYTDVSSEPHSTPFCAKNDGGVTLDLGGGPECTARK